VTAGVCASCGRSLDAHDRHVRFGLPDPVLALPEREQTPGTWLSHATPRESVMMQTPNVGAFVRALLPVHLTGGHTITYGVWLAINPAELRPTFSVWWEPQYADLQLDGYLANALPRWGLLRAPVHAVVRDIDETPYCVSSTDAELARVLAGEWDHDDFLA
jgi:hypothetical protein